MASSARTSETPGKGEAGERVPAAEAHWGPRFVANGTGRRNFERACSRNSRRKDWCRERDRIAEEYEAIAERAESAGYRIIADAAWRQGAPCWHWRKFRFVQYMVQQRAAHERAVVSYGKGAAGLRLAQRRSIPAYSQATLRSHVVVVPVKL